MVVVAAGAASPRGDPSCTRRLKPVPGIARLGERARLAGHRAGAAAERACDAHASRGFASARHAARDGRTARTRRTEKPGLAGRAGGRAAISARGAVSEAVRRAGGAVAVRSLTQTVVAVHAVPTATRSRTGRLSSQPRPCCTRAMWRAVGAHRSVGEAVLARPVGPSPCEPSKQRVDAVPRMPPRPRARSRRCWCRRNRGPSVIGRRCAAGAAQRRHRRRNAASPGRRGSAMR